MVMTSAIQQDLLVMLRRSCCQGDATITQRLKCVLYRPASSRRFLISSMSGSAQKPGRIGGGEVAWTIHGPAVGDSPWIHTVAGHLRTPCQRLAIPYSTERIDHRPPCLRDRLRHLLIPSAHGPSLQTAAHQSYFRQLVPAGPGFRIELLVAMAAFEGGAGPGTGRRVDAELEALPMKADPSRPGWVRLQDSCVFPATRR